MALLAPTQFGGNPADFPFFRDQVRTHLDSKLLTDAQRVEYLPKFLKGEVSTSTSAKGRSRCPTLSVVVR